MSFMHADLLLTTPAARRLFHDIAEGMPIVDYHCHLPPKEIALDRSFDNAAEAMLGGDHYKWRLMRACGVPEALITGDADPYEKFLAFARVLPLAAGNPVYQWTHLELNRYFGCREPLSAATAPSVWEVCNAKLRGGLTARRMIRSARVTDIITTDDPEDDLRWHSALQDETGVGFTVRPAWRPDRFLSIEAEGFADLMERLGLEGSAEKLWAWLLERMDHFAAHGCVASDHGLAALPDVGNDEDAARAAFARACARRTPAPGDGDLWRAWLMRRFGREYARRGWVMELHIGAARGVNRRSTRALGPDTGFDAIAPGTDIRGLAPLLNDLNDEGLLPRTILFSLDPGHNALLDTLCGCFHAEGSPGHVQHGAAWWFNDSRPGIKAQLSSAMSTSVYGCSVGMLTDSRSFLAYVRHEYFRRILCSRIGALVDAGEYPDSDELLRPLIEGLCYNNVRAFFRL